MVQGAHCPHAPQHDLIASHFQFSWRQVALPPIASHKNLVVPQPLYEGWGANGLNQSSVWKGEDSCPVFKVILRESGAAQGLMGARAGPEALESHGELGGRVIMANCPGTKGSNITTCTGNEDAVPEIRTNFSAIGF